MIRLKHLYISAIVYLFLPLLIFIFGWVNFYLSLVISVLTIFALYKSYINLNNKEKDINICFKEVLIYFIIFCIFLIVCGHGGGLFLQDFDWNKHNAIYHDLMNYDWPVVYKNNAMLTYYIGQYIVPSLIAKVFNKSYVVLRCSTVLWNTIGIEIVYIFMLEIVKTNTKNQKIIILIFLLFFSGMTNLGSFIYNAIENNTISLIPGSFKWINMYDVRIHFASNFDALWGAFQHVICPWISCCLFLLNKEKIECYAMFSFPLVFTSTFGFIYFVFILFIMFLYCCYKTKKLANVFSIENILLIPIFLIIVIYLSGNFLGKKPSMTGFSFFNIKDNILFYIVFCVSEFLLYGIFLYRNNKKNILYYIIIFELLIIPFCMMGEWNDLCSRGSIPARFILLILIIKQLFDNKYNFINKIIITLLLLAFINTFIEIGCHTYKNMKYVLNDETPLQDEYKSLEGFAGNPNIRVDNAYNYFTLDYNKCIFEKIAKRK